MNGYDKILNACKTGKMSLFKELTVINWTDVLQITIKYKYNIINILKYAESITEDIDYNLLIIEAIKLNDFELVKYLLSVGAKVTPVVFKKLKFTKNNYTLVHYILTNTNLCEHEEINKKFHTFLINLKSEIISEVSEFLGPDISSIIGEYLLFIYPCEEYEEWL